VTLRHRAVVALVVAVLGRIVVSQVINRRVVAPAAA